ncbi:MAG TPA: hypothetical protein VHC48_11320, partial [Puia sp.]|nr:hypothetical protein [Puia sp.]
MQHTQRPRAFFMGLSFLLAGICNLYAQEKREYRNISEALQASALLKGRSGPASLNWIQEGNQYSFIEGNEIHVMDPRTL